MSLDVWLTLPTCAECKRDGGHVFEYNITHNLGAMAEAAGLYNAMWRPDENGMMFAGDLIAQLAHGLDELSNAPSVYRKYDAPNGWGKYEHLVKFATEYLAACRQYPQALVKVWR